MSKQENIVYNFKTAGKEYNPVMMWFWNDVIKKSEITFQLEKFVEQGIVQFFIHPMYGFEQEYLSDEFFELVKFAVDEAKRLGMKFWIYDEYNWPSGTAGGKLLEQYPWTRGRVLVQYQYTLNSGHKITETKEGEFLAAFRIINDGKTTKMLDVTDKVEVIKKDGFTKIIYRSETVNSNAVNFYFIEDQKSLMASARWGQGLTDTFGYLDTFNPKAVRQYIEMTHEQYKKWIGNEFGKTVLGVFTDETTMCAVGDIAAGKTVWNNCLREEFIKKYGYDLAKYVYCLYKPAENETEKKAREDYWNLVGELYQTNFIKQMSDWCVENDLTFTGHFGGEEDLYWSLMETGDMMMTLTNLQIPGMDSILSSQFVNNTNFNVAGKMVSSVAKFENRDRILCETYTCSGWDLRMDLMKKIANRILVTGPNFIQYMGAYYSLDGARKVQPVGYPPSHSFNNPMFKYYNSFGDYIGGAQYLSSITKPNGKVLVVNPLSQMKQVVNQAETLKYTLPMDHPAQVLDKLYENTINTLLYNNIEFDLFSEDMAPRVEVKNNSATVGKYSYDYIIFPGFECFNEKIRVMVEKLIDTDTKLIFVNAFLENNIENGKLVLDSSKLTNIAAKTKSAKLYSYSSKNINLLKIDTVENFEDYQIELVNIIGEEYITLGIKKDGRVYTSFRSNETTEVIFIDNDDDKKVNISLNAVSGIKFYSFETRDEKAYIVNKNKIEIILNEYEMIAAIREIGSQENIGFTSEKLTENTVSNNKPNKEIELTEFCFKAVDGNALILDYEYKKDDMEDFVPCQLHYIFPDNANLNPLDKYTARSKFYIDDLSKPLYLNMDCNDIVKATLNGKPIDIIPNTRLWGPRNFKAEVTASLVKGENELILECQLPGYPMCHMIAFGFISGDFIIEKQSEKLVAVKNKNNIKFGNYEEQGYPYYSGDSDYNFNFVIDKKDFKQAFVEVETLDAFHVYLNGEFVKEVMWKPNCAELTGFIKEGKNELVIKTTSTYANMFNLKTVNGILSPVKIKFYK